jgi:hypothetical protein
VSTVLNPFDWADAGGAFEFYGLMAAIVIAVFVQLIGTRWDDWLDERWGRGSVRDQWLLGRIERDAKANPHSAS